MNNTWSIKAPLTDNTSRTAIDTNPPTTDKSASNIISLPLAFVRSGYVNLNAGMAYGVSRYLYGWSRAAESLAGAYSLGVNPTEVYPSANNYRWNGFPLRYLY